jgi:hypothetical protein
MMDILAIKLKLAEPECLCGQSVFFDVEVGNVSPAPADIPALDAVNRTVELQIGAGENGREPDRTANQWSEIERDGMYRDQPERRRVVTLQPRESLKLRGDLLSWFGPLPPGTHEITATYEGNLLVADSEPVRLRVLPARPVYASASRPGLREVSAPLAAAWIHRDASGLSLLYELLSPYLPRNARHAIRLAGVTDVASAHAACLVHEEATHGHLYWRTTRGKLYVAAVDLQSGQAAAPAEVKLPFEGSPLDSALSMPDGALMLPLADAARKRLAVLRVAPTGEATACELGLGDTSPIGPYVCYWEACDRLHFAWAKPGGRQVEYALLALDDFEAGFAARKSIVSQDPVLWLDAFLDVSAVGQDMPYFQEQVPEDQQEEDFESQPPRLTLWCLVRRVGRLGCMRVRVSDGQSRAVTSFGTQGLSEPRVLGSAVTCRDELAVLLADSSGALHYGSTARRTMQPLASLTDQSITADHAPALLAASEKATMPWVHLRYLEAGEAIRYLRLEPEDEPDPTEPEPEHHDQEAQAEPGPEADEDDFEEQAPEQQA